MSDDLDLSWIEEEQSLLEGPTTQSRKTIMSEINFHCIYIGLHQEIVSHVRNRCSLEMRDTHSILTNARLLKYIKEFQRVDGIKYKLGDMLLYHVNIDFENIQAFVSCGSVGQFQPISLFEDVVVEPSLSIFHEINEIYMFYQEKSLVSVDLVSILKNELTQKSAHTKRVRISNPDTPVKKRNKGTRKKG
jgi:hypothetical protein